MTWDADAAVALKPVGAAGTVVADAAPVRAAPYGGASAAATVQAGGALLVGRGYGPWIEVHRSDGIHGWVLGGEITGL